MPRFGLAVGLLALAAFPSCYPEYRCFYDDRAYRVGADWKCGCNYCVCYRDGSVETTQLLCDEDTRDTEETTSTNWTATAPSTPLAPGCYFTEIDGTEGVIRRVAPTSQLTMDVLFFETPDWDVTSLMWFDGSWLLALSSEGLLVVDDATGTSEAYRQFEPEALGNAKKRGFWSADLEFSTTAERYWTLADYLVGQPIEGTFLPGLGADRGSILGSRLYGIGNPGESVTWTPIRGAARDELGLFWPDPYPSDIKGISAFEGAILLLDGNGMVHHYDSWTGIQRDAWPTSYRGVVQRGLWCTSGP